jgi:hypothetical protein
MAVANSQLHRIVASWEGQHNTVAPSQVPESEEDTDITPELSKSEQAGQHLLSKDQ